MNCKKYTTSCTHRARKILLFVLIAAILGTVVFSFAYGRIIARAEEQLITCWVMCKPGDYVNLRRGPDKSSMVIGRLDACDSFQTDAVSKNGFIRVVGMTEALEAWVYCGYVVTEEPEPLFCNCYNSSYGRVACRRWISGPKVDGSSWLAPMSEVSVFYQADGWACTSRGYIRYEYLEADP